MRINNLTAYNLARSIKKNIRKEFEQMHLSGNLMNTIDIVFSGNSVQVVVNAQTYNIPLYINTKKIVYTGNGSYAEEVNQTGGFSKTHDGYIENAIFQAIGIFLSKLNGEATFKMQSFYGDE